MYAGDKDHRPASRLTCSLDINSVTQENKNTNHNISRGPDFNTRPPEEEAQILEAASESRGSSCVPQALSRTPASLGRSIC